MNRLLLAASIALSLPLLSPAHANFCALPRTAASGAGLLVTGARPASALGAGSAPVLGSAYVTVGLPGGLAASSSVVAAIGAQFASQGAFSCFLSTDTPLAVSALPGTDAIRRLVPSPAKTMTLEWTHSLARLPVTYEVFLGTSPSSLSTAARGLVGTANPLANLSFTTPYYWQVAASDEFGRKAVSDIYSFSISPVSNHLIAAPNPFHPGLGVTTFLFSMPGAGSATLELFSLPDARRLFQRRYDGLQSGMNTIAYDGRDDGGRLLPNGVYTVRLTKKGATGNDTELFRLVAAR